MKTKNTQKGFTLIELVLVIVILGVLAAVALPKFVDISGNARTASAQGVAGALASASSINYSADLAKGQVAGATIATATAQTGIASTAGGCTTAVGVSLLDGGSSTIAASGVGTFNLSGGAALTLIGGTTTCTVFSNDDNTKTATFTLYGAK